MTQLNFEGFNKYDLFNLLYLAKMEIIGHDELRESAVSITGNYEVAEELLDFIYSTNPNRFTERLAGEWTEYCASREIGFLTGWVYGITLVNILQLIYKFWVAVASRQEIFEDALDLTGEARDKVVANSLADYVEKLNPDEFENEQLEVWLCYKAEADSEIVDSVSFNPITMKRLVEQDGLLLKMFDDLSLKMDEVTALEVLFNSEVVGDNTYEGHYLELVQPIEMSSIEGFAKAYQIIRDTGRCVFNRKDFGTAWEDIASGVIDMLEGLKCSIKVFLGANHILVICLD